MSTPVAPAGSDASAAPAEQQAAAGDSIGGSQTGAAPAEGSQGAPAADPRVLQQMQQQLEQFGGVVGQMAEYLPAIGNLAQQQGGQAQEPSLEELAAQVFGGPQGAPQGYPGADPYAGDPGYVDAYGNPVDAYGNPVQGQQPMAPQMQQQQQPDPNAMIDLFRAVVRQEVTPLQQELQGAQQERQQQAWNALYEEFPAMKDQAQAPQIAGAIAQAAQLFARDRNEAERFANDPRFVRMAYLASVNQAQGQGEIPAGASDGVAPIEAAGGASAPGTAETDPGDDIVNAGRGAAPAGAGAYFG